MFHALWRWCFGPRLELTAEVRPGDRVRKVDDELIGTVSALMGGQRARVVYCGNRTSWVELIDRGLLRPA